MEDQSRLGPASEPHHAQRIRHNAGLHVTHHSQQGIELAPFYDLLSTAVYTTRALADEKAHWPNVELALTLGDATTFAAVTRQHLLAAGQTLGLSPSTTKRELERLIKTVARQAPSLLAQLESQMPGTVASSAEPDLALRYVGGELRLLRTIVHIVIQEMVGRLAKE